MSVPFPPLLPCSCPYVTASLILPSPASYLAEQKEVDLNIRDRWDSTPLYYACLCGHLDLVKYLLSRGAVCDASTFDGERCVYGALTNEIRS